MLGPGPQGQGGLRRVRTGRRIPNLETVDIYRYQNDPKYRARIEACRKGGRSRSQRKIEAARRNVAKSPGRPRKDGRIPKWEEKGLDLAEAKRQHQLGENARRAKEARALMRDQGWPLEAEHRWEDRHIAAETWEAAEEATRAWIAREGGSGTRALYERWADVEQKNLNPEGEIPPRDVLRLLCRYRLTVETAAETGPETAPANEAETGEAVDGFAI